MTARGIAGWAIIALLVTFIGFNWQTASVRFFAMRLEMPLGILLLATAACGAIVTLLFLQLARRRA
jgi:uncharacterized integral membrane protein